jgi:hypothetical protein
MNTKIKLTPTLNKRSDKCDNLIHCFTRVSPTSLAQNYYT